MIAAYLLYCLLASLLLAVVGYLFEHVARLLRLPARVAWVGALGVLLFLAASAPLRTHAGAPIPVEETGRVALSTTVAEGGAHGTVLSDFGLSRVLDGALRWALPLGRGRLGIVLAIVWAAMSALVLAVGLAVLRRAWRRRRGWPCAVVAGATVRISPHHGPAVVGLVRPEILVPRWLMEASEERREMAIRHEREHLRAGDPYLLAMAGLVTALLPWNPVLWWMCGRLRLAIELDCDRRVLRRGVPRRAYGSFLIDTAALGGGHLRGAVTFAPPTSTLRRRLSAMTSPRPRHALTRAALVAALGGAALVAACESRLPTQAEIDDMDATTAEVKLHELIPTRETTAVSYYVDGVQVTPAEAKAIIADGVARVEIARGADGDRISIMTVEAAEVAGVPIPRRKGVATVSPLPTAPDAEHVLQKLRAAEPLVLIDEEVVSGDRLNTLDPDDIQSIEVIKGPAATKIYTQPEAAQGVIRITTKRRPER